MPGPTFLETDRLTLAPAEEDDLSFLVETVNHPQIREYVSSYRTPYNEEQYHEEFWPPANGDDGVTLLALPKEGESANESGGGFVDENAGESAGEPAGSVQLSPVMDRDGYANFGVWLHPDWWGHGYALEASVHLIAYGFDHLRLHRVSTTTQAPNEAAATLCERLGFAHEGTARESQFADGRYVDVERWGLLVDEWDGPDAVLRGE